METWIQVRSSEKEKIKEICPFEKKYDVFKNELTILSRHISYLWEPEYNGYRHFYKGVSPYYDIPLDVLYKSNHSGEKIFIIINEYLNLKSYPLYLVTNIIFNIDGKKNIIITKKYADIEYERLEITKEQLYELCMASSLMIQINGSDGIMGEFEANNFKTILQALYNDVFDNKIFTEAKNIIIKHVENRIKEVDAEQEEKRTAEEEDYNKRHYWDEHPWQVVFMVLGITALLVLFAVFLASVIY